MTHHASGPRLATLALTAVFSAAHSGLAAAQTAATPAAPLAAADDVFTLGTIVVSAPGAAPLASGGYRVEQDAIRLHDRETVGGALELAPGVNQAYIGGRGEQVVFVRGFDRLQVPVYIDGIPTYVPYDGNIDLGRFTTFDLARIDVAKGFASLIYGPNTLGGAINLVTRRPTRAFEGEIGGGFGLSATGDPNSYRGYANVGANRGTWWVQGGVSYLDVDDFRLPDRFEPTNAQQGEGRRENSQRRDGKASFKLGYTPNATDEYVFGYVHQDGEKGQPTYAGDLPATGQRKRWWEWPQWDKRSVFVTTHTRFGEHGIKVRAYHDIFQNSMESFAYDKGIKGARQSGYPSKYDDDTTGLSVEGDFALSATNRLQVAYHFKDDVHRSRNAGEPETHFKDRTQSFALEDSQILSERLTLVGGVSWNTRASLKAENYGTHAGSPKTKTLYDEPTGDDHALNAQLGLFVKTGEAGQARVTVARKSRFATMKDRYSTRFGTVIPSPDLEAERATHYELGYAGPLAANGFIDAALFRSDITDSIQQVTVAPQGDCAPTCAQYQNIAKARHTGVEVAVEGSAGPWELAASYTWLLRENLSNTRVRPTDTPRHRLFAAATWHHGAWRVTASGEGASKRHSASDGSQVAAGYAVYHLKAGYRFANGSLVEAGVRNLFDRLYAYSEGYPEAGRNYFVQFNVPL